jgi:hypothetical protein
MSCTIVNDIDVCERKPPPIEDLNRRTENDQYYQYFSGMHQLIPSTQETWLTVWTSDLETSGVNRSDLRLARLDEKGSPMRTCGEEAEFTVVDALPNIDSENNLYAPSLVSPRGGRAAPLLLWGYDDGQVTTLYGELLSEQGCPSVERQRFVVRQQPGVCSSFSGRTIGGTSRCLFPFRAAALDGGSDDAAHFVVAWREAEGLSLGTILARVLKYQGGEKFLPTALDSTGGAAALFRGSRQVVHFDLAGLSDGRWALAWVELVDADTQVAWLQLWNERLEALSEPVEIHRGPVPAAIYLDATSIGNDVGVTCIVDGGVLSLVASGEDGRVLAQRTLPSNSADWPRIAAQGSDHLVLTWSEGPPHLVATLLDRNLSPKFNNQACDSDAFVVSGTAGSAVRAELGFDTRGGLLIAWTSSTAGGDDRSGTALRSRYYSSNVLEP